MKPAGADTDMLLTESLAAWQSTDFNDVFKAEVKRMNPDLLPLQQGLAHSSSANGANIGVTILNSSETPDTIQVKAGLFYTGIIAGCSCADDPTTQHEVNEYCEVRFEIAKLGGESTVTLLRD
jgi:hypothetical protein